MGSPARTHRSYISQVEPSYEERVGYFAMADSSAPVLPTAKRFNQGRPAHSDPGPGHYSGGSSSSFARPSSGGVIGRAQRSLPSRQVQDGTPGPAAYSVSLNRPNATGTFPRSQRSNAASPMRTAATSGGFVGPGTYSPEPTLSPRRGTGTFSKAGRATRGQVREGSPGPGHYGPPVVAQRGGGNVKGGSFSRSVRDPLRGYVGGGGGGGGSAAYQSGMASTLSQRGGAVAQTGRREFTLSPRCGDTGPGPGAYTPLYAVSSGNTRSR